MVMVGNDEGMKSSNGKIIMNKNNVKLSMLT